MDSITSFVKSRKRHLEEEKKKIDPERKYIRRGEFERLRIESYNEKIKQKKKVIIWSNLNNKERGGTIEDDTNK